MGGESPDPQPPGPARVPYSAGALRAAKVTLGTIAQAAATMTAQANSETKVRCSE
jgi:hypothetical protein